VVDALAAPVDTPQLVVADRVAAVEVGDAVGAAVGGRQSVGPALFLPAGAGGGADTQRSELVEGERAVRTLADRVLDPGQLGIERRIRGLLPGLRALEGDPAAGQEAAQGLPADPGGPGNVAPQVISEFAD
jgi:hypothetical protein